MVWEFMTYDSDVLVLLENQLYNLTLRDLDMGSYLWSLGHEIRVIT